MMTEERKTCVVIPTFNNGVSVRAVVEGCLRHCADVIVVNDGSTDGTGEILGSIGGITVIDYAVNRGKGYALKLGLLKAREMGFSHAITIDSDGQHYPDDIPAFLAASNEHPEAIIVGNRRLEGVTRSSGSVFANKFSNFWFWVQTGCRLPDTQSGYRLYPLKRLPGLRLLTSRYEAELELLVPASWHGVDIMSIPIDVYYPPQEERVSHFRPGRDFARITVLNTVLCLFALIYGLPLRLWRWLARLLRTAYAVVFCIVVIMLTFSPLVWIYSKVGKMTEEKRLNIHKLIHWFARTLMFRIGIPGATFTCKGGEKVDWEKPSVIICNHQSHLDLMCQLVFTPKIVFLTNDWVWNSPIFGTIIRNAEYYPVSAGLETLLPRLRNLAERGYHIAIYPEGTRSPDCRVQRFHKGAFYVAEQLGLDVLPMFLKGTGHVLPKKRYLLEKGDITIEVGSRISQQQLSEIGNIRQQASFMRKWYKRLIVFLVAMVFCTAVDAQVNIWEGTETKKVELTPYVVPGTGNAAVIVCPGGSYFWHDMTNEGREVALWLNRNGITAFVLRYRTAYVPAFITRYRYLFRGNRYPDAQEDLIRSLRLVREHAADYGIDAGKVGVMGFSAGGHLVMSAPRLMREDEMPQFIACIYPVVTMSGEYCHKRSRRALLGDNKKGSRKMQDSLSVEKHIPKGCAPVFLVNCVDDPIVDYHNSVLLDSALTAEGVPHRYIQYKTGGHGFGAKGNGNGNVNEAAGGFLPTKRDIRPYEDEDEDEDETRLQRYGEGSGSWMMEFMEWLSKLR